MDDLKSYTLTNLSSLTTEEICRAHSSSAKGAGKRPLNANWKARVRPIVSKENRLNTDMHSIHTYSCSSRVDPRELKSCKTDHTVPPVHKTDCIRAQNLYEYPHTHINHEFEPSGAFSRYRIIISEGIMNGRRMSMAITQVRLTRSLPRSFGLFIEHRIAIGVATVSKV